MDKPLKCISFSPNWFYPQILQVNQHFVCYGANEQVFVFDMITKNFKYTLQGSQKVTLLFLKDHLIFIGCEGGIISVFQDEKYLGKLELNIETPMILKYIDDYYLLFDSRGIGVTFQLNQQFQLIHFTLKLITQPHCLPKYVDDKIVLYQSGRIYRFSDQLQYDYPYKILCADNYGNKYGVLNKLHKIITLHIFTINDINYWVKNNQIKENEPFIELKYILNDKLPNDNLKKAPLSIKFLNNNSIFVTSKQGEIFLINLINCSKILKLDANSINEELFYKLPDETHNKGIYLFNNYNNIFYTTGLDRKVCLFNYEEGQISNIYKISCLSNKVNKLQIGKEHNLIYYYDQILKSIDLTKQQYPIYTNEFWKICNFDQFYISPLREGVIAIQKEQKIEIIDIYKQSVLDKIQCSDPISKIFWINKIQAQQLCILFNIQFNLINAENKQHNINDFLVIIMLSGKLQVIYLQNGQYIIDILIQQTIDIKQLVQNYQFDFVTIKISSIQLLFFNNQCSICFIFNQNFIFYYSNDIIDCKQIHNQEINSIDLQYYQNNLFLITGCINQTISINIINNSIILLGYLKHKFSIEKVKIYNNLIAASAKNHSSLQIWDISTIIEQLKPNKYNLEGLEKANIRGHCGYLLDFIFYNDDQIITTSEDQTIKIFQISKIENKYPPNKKKNKKKVKIE